MGSETSAGYEVIILCVVIALQTVYTVYAWWHASHLRSVVPARADLHVDEAQNIVDEAQDTVDEMEAVVVDTLPAVSAWPPALPTEANVLAKADRASSNAPSGTTQIARLSAKPVSPAFAEILEDLNEYAQTNRGAASDFAIVKDAVDRPLDALIDHAESRITTPLYLGLAGALFGIVVGVFAMASGIEDPVAAGTAGRAAVANAGNIDGVIGQLGTLLRSVGYAMIASLLGVVFTLTLSMVTRHYVKVLDQRRNSFFTYYQIKFLPKLSRDVNSVLSSLNGTLQQFNQSFVGNISEMQDGFRENSEVIKQQSLVLKQISELSVGDALADTVRLYESVSAASKKLTAIVPFMERTHASLALVGEATAPLRETAGAATRLAQLADNLETMVDESREIQEFVGRHIRELNVVNEEAGSTSERMLGDFRASQRRFSSEMTTLTESLLRVADDVGRATTAVVEEAGEKLEGVPEALEAMVKEKFTTETVREIRDSSNRAAEAASSAATELAANSQLRGEVRRDLNEQMDYHRQLLASEVEQLKKVVAAVDVLKAESRAQSRALLHVTTPWYRRLIGRSDADRLTLNVPADGQA